MKKIFILSQNAYPNSETAVKKVLSDYFQIGNAQIMRGDHGKPFLVGGKDLPLFFSVAHTDNKLFIAVSDENVGIDAENISRKVDYAPIVKRFSQKERTEIVDSPAFLRHWTAKESAVKWLGGSLAHDLHKLRFENDTLYYGEIEIPAKLRFHSIENCIVCVCSERDFADPELITI